VEKSGLENRLAAWHPAHGSTLEADLDRHQTPGLGKAFRPHLPSGGIFTLKDRMFDTFGAPEGAKTQPVGVLGLAWSLHSHL
jgi:hypothetical protein